jgi:hypothetical protein
VCFNLLLSKHARDVSTLPLPARWADSSRRLRRRNETVNTIKEAQPFERPEGDVCFFFLTAIYVPAPLSSPDRFNIAHVMKPLNKRYQLRLNLFFV